MVLTAFGAMALFSHLFQLHSRLGNRQARHIHACLLSIFHECHVDHNNDIDTSQSLNILVNLLAFGHLVTKGTGILVRLTAQMFPIMAFSCTFTRDARLC